MGKNFVIYEENEQYGRKLLTGLSDKSRNKVGVQLFTERTELVRYLSGSIPEAVVISEDSMFDELSDIYDGKIIILSEESCVSDSGSEYASSKYTVYRYQTLDKIYKEIMDITKLSENKKFGAVEIIGIYSPVNVDVKSIFSICLSKVLSDKYRVLYLNFDEFSGLEEILTSENSLNLSDAIYYYSQGKEQSSENIATVINECAGIDFITPASCAEDVSYMSASEIYNFIQYMAESLGYEAVVIDISSAISHPWELMEYCSMVYMPVKNDYISMQKIKSFENYYLGIGKENILTQIEKIRIPEGEIIQKDNFWTQITYMGMYRFAGKLIENRHRGE